MKSTTLESALEQAVCKHFSTLFEVLMVDPSEKGLLRFENGLKKLSDAEAAVAGIIHKQPEGTS